VSAGGSLRSDNSPNAAAAVTNSGPPGAGAIAIPSPGALSSGSSGSAPVATSLGRAVTTISASVATATNQVADSLPAVATVTSVFNGVARTSSASQKRSVRQRADNDAKRREIGAPRVRQNFGYQRRNNNSK
jgi:hypothetical protein